ncbi:MAG: H-NS histone family protein [Rubrivivax sp.]|nr:H-NS histone family protein [Rubrivivax sp.]
MTQKTYQQILKQIEGLQAEAEKQRRAEVADVIAKIRSAIVTYGLTAGDLGFGGTRSAAAKGATRKKPGRKPGRPRKVAAASGRKVAPKFRDENGNTWAGRGKRPVWLRTALASGRKLEDFAIK